MTDRRIEELEALAMAEGLTLPLSPETIVAIEDKGGMVHLESGNVLWNGTEYPIGLRATILADVLLHLEDVEVGGDILELALWPWEDRAQVAADLAAHFDETERRPDMGEPLTDDEYLDMLGEWEGW